MKNFNLKICIMKFAACIAMCAGSYTLAAAEPIDGVLEQSGAYSVLFTTSPESGDLIAYPFKNTSPVGKTILTSCLPGLICEVGQATTKEMRDPSVLNFKDQPAVWLEITRAAKVSMKSAITQYEKSIKTRYGVLSVRENDATLQFKGKPVVPAVVGNNSLSIVGSYELGKNDVVLLQNNGGTSCPALYIFVTINATSLRATPEFGTCSDIIYPTSDLKNSVTLVSNHFNWPFDKRADQQKSAMTKTIFRYTNGQMTQDQKPLK